MHVCGVDGVSQAPSHGNTDGLADEGAELRARPSWPPRAALLLLLL